MPVYSDVMLEKCFEDIDRGAWSWFATLRYLPMLDPKDGVERYDNSKDALKVWLEEIQREYVGRAELPYVFTSF
jgi:hypothetical protein